MVTYFDMCQQGYNSSFEAKADNAGREQVLMRRFIGTDLTSLSTTTTDVFKILKVSKNQLVNRVWTTVTKADDTAITLSIGYTDGTNTSANAFEADAALDSTGVTESADDKIFFDDDGYYLTITLSALSDLDAATEFSIMAEIIDFRGVGVTTALTAPV